MKKQLLFGLAMLFASCLFSQQEPVLVPLDSVMAAYDEEVMLFNPSKGEFIINKKERKMGFFYIKLRRELENSEKALGLYKKWRGRQWRGTALMVGSVVGMFATLIIVPGPVGMVFLVPYVIGMVDLVESSKFFHLAIWQYNRDELEKRLAPTE